MTNLISKHGGYRNLKSFQMAQIAFDLNFQFCERFVPSFKMRDQMEGAGRGGVQNIGEGSKTSGTSKESEIRLVNVAKASLEELKLDLEAYLRQRNLPLWSKDDKRSLEIRKLAYDSNRSYRTYLSYLSEAESATNCLLCIINQACYLLDKQLQSLDKNLQQHGDFKDRIKDYKKKEIMRDNEQDYDEFLKKFNMKMLESGQVVPLDQKDKEEK